MSEHTENMPLERDRAGYFVERPVAKRAPHDPAQGPVDDEPDSEALHPPGTVDDVPYTLGEEVPDPADAHLGAPVTPPQSKVEYEPGTADEAELWIQQRALIREDVAAGYSVEQFSAEEIARIAEALGEDAGEDLPDAPEGTSATGSAPRR
jgi:hypothetical protein